MISDNILRGGAINAFEIMKDLLEAKNSNKKSKTQIILSMLQSKSMKVDKDDSESGGSDAGPYVTLMQM